MSRSSSRSSPASRDPHQHGRVAVEMRSREENAARVGEHQLLHAGVLDANMSTSASRSPVSGSTASTAAPVEAEQLPVDEGPRAGRPRRRPSRLGHRQRELVQIGHRRHANESANRACSACHWFPYPARFYGYDRAHPRKGRSHVQMITPCLWVRHRGRSRRAALHVGLPQLGSLTSATTTRPARGTAGAVMIVEFELDGQRFTALNGGPEFKFNEAVLFQIACATPRDVDHYWSKLTEGGEEARAAGQDRFGVSWQVVPTPSCGCSPAMTRSRSKRVMTALFGMKKPTSPRSSGAPRRARRRLTPASS